jgi:hypothetical protein
MSIWLAKALAARVQPALACSEACANSVISANSPAGEELERGFGTNGTIGTISGVSADEIRSRFEWMRQRLVEDHGRDPERAEIDARAILRSELLNDGRLAPMQPDTTRCFVCGGFDRPGHVLVPVLTARPDTPLWLHLEPCHQKHRSRQSMQVDDLLTAALGVACGSTGRRIISQVICKEKLEI